MNTVEKSAGAVALLLAGLAFLTRNEDFLYAACVVVIIGAFRAMVWVVRTALRKDSDGHS